MASSSYHLDQDTKDATTCQPDHKPVAPSNNPVLIDDSWFPSNSCFPSINTQVPNPWLQKLVPAANIDIFDGDPRSWPRFIAGFKSMVHDSLPSDVDRLAVLTQLLSPRLREGFTGLLWTPTMYRQVLQELEKLYGDPAAAVQAHALTLSSVEPLRRESLAELERFYLQLNGPVSVLEMNNRQSELNSIILFSQISSKLTRSLREKWAHRLHSQLAETLSLRHFVDWLKDLVMEKRFLTTFVSHDRTVVPTISYGKRRGVFHVVADPNILRATVMAPIRHYVVCEVDSHGIVSCPTFLKMNATESLSVVRQSRLCHRCLGTGHVKRMCRSKGKCTVYGCKGAHHPLLHGAPRMYPGQNIQQGSPLAMNTEEHDTSVITARVNCHSNKVRVLCAVVPILVTSGTTTCRSHALLDSGAEVSMMWQQLSQRLNMHGEKRMFDIRTVNGASQVPAIETKCTISAVDRSTTFEVDPLIIVANMKLSVRSVSRQNLQSNWAHLSNLPLCDVTDDDVGILIGMNVPLAHRHYDLRLLKTGSV
uniref:CCHC-type domain-containing protein n=1 Tax=Trichuris muris TaxID=70415 RepID=A0A5S6QIG6_TRIMR